MKRLHEGNSIVTVAIYLIVILLAFIALYPMYYVLILSLSEPAAAVTMRVYWLPKGFYLDTYKMFFIDKSLWRAYLNTIMYAFVTTILMLVTSVLAAFPLTYKKLIGRKFINMFLLIPMYISGGLIPTFILMTKLGLYGSPLAIILPGCFSIWYIILVKSYFNTIPDALYESASIDGANNYQILLNIYLPSSKPILAVIAVYTIVGVWNSWFSSMVYLPVEKWQPLQMHLRRILVLMQGIDMSAANMGPEYAEEIAAIKLSSIQIRYAMIIFTTLPVIFTYPFFQKYFVKGVMLGSLKE